jgi:hypothetical protein
LSHQYLDLLELGRDDRAPILGRIVALQYQVQRFGNASKVCETMQERARQRKIVMAGDFSGMNDVATLIRDALKSLATGIPPDELILAKAKDAALRLIAMERSR